MNLPVDIDGVRRDIEQHWESLGIVRQARPLLTAISDVERDNRQAAEFAKRLLDDAEVRGFEKATILPGAKDVLRRCVEASVPFAVATNNGRRVASRLVAELLGLANAPVLTRDDVRRPKPAPDMLIRACRELKATAPHKIWFVGDGRADMMAAQGARVLGWNVSAIWLGGHARR